MAAIDETLQSHQWQPLSGSNDVFQYYSVQIGSEHAKMIGLSLSAQSKLIKLGIPSAVRVVGPEGPFDQSVLGAIGKLNAQGGESMTRSLAEESRACPLPSNDTQFHLASPKFRDVLNYELPPPKCNPEKSQIFLILSSR